MERCSFVQLSRGHGARRSEDPIPEAFVDAAVVKTGAA